MKFSAVVTSLVCLGTALAVPVEIAQREADANLPGLDATQSKNARGVIDEVKTKKVGLQGCLASVATGLTESSMLIYANKAVPKSLDYPHDAVGSNYDSIGIFQQRAEYYPDIATDMSASGSAGQFIAKMVKVSGWKTMNVGELCQKVQVSAYPDRYEEHVAAAKKICNAEGIN